MQCPACNHEASDEQFGGPLRCPDCGAFYAKALALKQRRDGAVAAVAVKSPKKSLRFNWQYGGIALGVIFVLYVIAAPYITVHQIKQAAKDRDAEALSEHVDFPSVRESMKAQLNAKIMKDAGKELEGNPFAAFGLALAGTLIDKMVDVYATPAGLAQIMSGGKPAMPGAKGPSSEAGTVPEAPKEEPFARASMGYEGVSKFVVEVPDNKGGIARFILRRDGIGWLLSDIRIPLDS